ncbi:hypothetical protein RugamoR64_05400 [Duganella rhizosphaerae]|uniref:cytochrome o ubiquinol oxidase subunit IV n=1 Tax=Duganella rhizosphaerae TaxID=2885763 RepID=UPI0030E79BD4
MKAHHTSSHGGLQSHGLGLALSALLALASFSAVMSGVIPPDMRLVSIVVLAVAQLLAQLIYFLHMGAAKDQRENTAVFICTALLIVIVVAGSLCVMHNANINMMPTDMSPQRAAYFHG